MSDAILDQEALPDRIAATYSNKTVLITGASGFMGKVLLERLLRKCPDIKEIIMVVRNKKGKSSEERLKVIFSNPLFEQVTALRGGLDTLLQKVKVVHGDMQEPGLDMSEEDQQYVIDNVDIIVHAAATIRFDEELRKAILLNVRGTKLMLELARRCKKLKLFIHISTAYCHLQEKLLEEKPYPPPADPHHIISTAEIFDEDTMATIAPRLLNKLPNSYAFTKALAEALVVEAMGKIPILILRPSIVVPMWKDPLPGWTDNINGPTGLLIGAGKGVLRSMYCKSNSYADYIPVDVFISGIMIVTWNFLENGDKQNTIYNFTSSAEVKVTWEEMIEMGKQIIISKVPLNGVVWYPGGSMKHNRLTHSIACLLFHWLPALLVDTLLVILRYDPVLLRVHRRISKGFEVFEYYTTRQWDFKSDVGQMVRSRLNAREKDEYKVDSDGVDIPLYFEDCVRAARRYILHEPDETIPAARRHMQIMRVVDIVFKIAFSCLFIWIFLRFTTSVFSGPKHDQVIYI